MHEHKREVARLRTDLVDARAQCAEMRAELDTLREMETLPAMSGSVRIFHREDDLYPRDDEGNMLPGKGLSFSDLEARLPQVLPTRLRIPWPSSRWV